MRLPRVSVNSSNNSIKVGLLIRVKLGIYLVLQAELLSRLIAELSHKEQVTFITGLGMPKLR